MKDTALESSPASPAPKLTERRLRTRLLRWSLFGLAGLLSLIGLFYAVENLRGAMAWKKAKARAIAAGEPLTIADIVPPPVPDEDNAAASPVFRELFDFGERDESGYRVHRNYEKLAGLSQALVLRRFPGALPDPTGFLAGRHTDIDAWAKHMSSKDHPRPFEIDPNARTPADIVLSALDDLEPILSRHIEVSRRPHAVFPITYEDHVGALLPHLSTIKHAATAVNLRACVRLEKSDHQKAFQDSISGLRIASLPRSEPILISSLVQIASLTIALQPLWEGLERHAWSERQLREFDVELAPWNLGQRYRECLKGEMALMVAAFDDWQNAGLHMGLVEDEQRRNARMWDFAPRGWTAHSKAALVNFHLDHIRPIVDAAGRFNPEQGNQLGPALDDLTRRGSPREFLAKLTLPPIGAADYKHAMAQTHIDLARIACALERHFLAHDNAFPAKLDALEAAFPEGIPTDRCSGMPYRYGLNADGSYYLYSEGWDQEDDGGTVTFKNGRLNDADEKDWVWRFPDGRKPVEE